MFLTGLTLQAGTTSAVKAVKLGAKLVSGRQPPAGDRLPADGHAARAGRLTAPLPATAADAGPGGLTWSDGDAPPAQGVALAGGARSVAPPGRRRGWAAPGGAITHITCRT